VSLQLFYFIFSKWYRYKSINFNSKAYNFILSLFYTTKFSKFSIHVCSTVCIFGREDLVCPCFISDVTIFERSTRMMTRQSGTHRYVTPAPRQPLFTSVRYIPGVVDPGLTDLRMYDHRYINPFSTILG
jgi:hypothetical protein